MRGAGNIAAVKDRCVCADETRAEIEGGEQREVRE